jgi:phosphoenolpyruvate---glycerone phosphotransferase subunit DhaK
MTMKKFLNDPENLVPELLEGYAAAYPDKIKLVDGRIVVRAHSKEAGKVGVVGMGGSGHEPALSGYVGYGLYDVSVAGEIFSAPSAPHCFAGLKLGDHGAGVVYIVYNHDGDKLAANLAMQMANKAGMNVKKIVTSDDVSNAPRSDPENRRGLNGGLYVIKVAGAAAEAGYSLDQVAAVAERMADNIATLAVAVKTATHPVTGQEFFQLPDDEMEVGMGQHGEAGSGRMKMKSADETAELMLDYLLKDLSVKPGEQVVVMLNGTGSTTHMELFIIFRRVAQILKEKNIKLVDGIVGELLTVQEQGGFQMNLARMDDELLRLWKAPCDSPYLTRN